MSTALLVEEALMDDGFIDHKLLAELERNWERAGRRIIDLSLTRRDILTTLKILRRMTPEEFGFVYWRLSERVDDTQLDRRLLSQIYFELD